MTQKIDTDQFENQIRKLMKLRLPLLAGIVVNIYWLNSVAATAKHPPEPGSQQLVAEANTEGTADTDRPVETEGHATNENTSDEHTPTDSSTTAFAPAIDLAQVQNTVSDFSSVADSLAGAAAFAGKLNPMGDDGNFIEQSIGGLLKRIPKSLPADSEQNTEQGPPIQTGPVQTGPIQTGPIVPSIRISNAVDSGGEVSFRLGKETITLQPGEEISREETELRVGFHRGGKFGISRQTLTSGNYVFEVSNTTGWVLTSTEN